jgi:hypothetical protein
MIASSLSHWEETFAEEIVIERPSKFAKRSGDLQGRHAATFSLSAPHVAVCLSFVRAKV